MSTKRKIQENLLRGISYFAAFVSLSILGLIIMFIFNKGLGTLSWDLMSKSYHAENLLIEINEGILVEEIEKFRRPENLGDDTLYSTRYGVALKEGYSAEKELLVEIQYIEDNSPLKEAIVVTTGPRKGQKLATDETYQIQKVNYQNSNGETKSAGPILGQNARELIEILENEANSLNGLYLKTSAGGIRSVILQTLILIVLTLMFALPLGLSSAIYLSEIAVKGAWKDRIENSIELLSGVPSIVFGLTGLSLLYPLTRLLGIEGPSLILGALTLTVVLLPLIIRQSQEALESVPSSYRMASLSLGASKTETIFKLILPNALPGILTAVLLSIARIIAESAALIFTLGVAVNDHISLKEGGSTLAVFIWSVMGDESPNFELAAAVSIIILTLVLALNLLVKFISWHIQRKKFS